MRKAMSITYKHKSQSLGVKVAITAAVWRRPWDCDENIIDEWGAKTQVI